MISYTNALKIYQENTNNEETGNTTFFDLTFNEKTRQLLSRRDWPFLERLKTLNTVDGNQLYKLPANFKKLLGLFVQIGTQKYIPEMVPNRKFWDRITASQSVESNIPQWMSIINRQIGLYPASSGTDGVINYRYKIRQKDITIVDYTAGTIVSIADGGTTVIGDSTVWTSKMAGRWIRITDSDTANTGDGEWYEIESVTSGTELELVSAYNGGDIAGGSAAYAIGQVSEIPEDYQMIPVYEAISDYWAKEIDPRAVSFQNKADVLKQEMIEEFYSLSEDPVIEEDVQPLINPNLTIRA